MKLDRMNIIMQNGKISCLAKIRRGKIIDIVISTVYGGDHIPIIILKFGVKVERIVVNSRVEFIKYFLIIDVIDARQPYYMALQPFIPLYQQLYINY